MSGDRLDRETRSAALARMRSSATSGVPLDVLVIGGGVTGAGIALDAASRGLATGIVEARDWAAGTSSRSSKLMHGGLRYLQRLDFSLVYEALTERDLLLTKLAPHLVRPVSFLYPLKRPVFDRLFVGAGIALYDVLATLHARKRSLPWHRHLSRRGLARAHPGLRRDAAAGAIEYWDATVDDARFVATLMRTAVSEGALAAARAQVVELHKNETGRVDGATIADLETGERFEVRATTVINATGVWTEQTQSLAATDGLKVLASKGIHLVVPRSRIPGQSGLILRTRASVLFVIPWSRYWIIGTTDTPWTESLEQPVPSSRDIDYVLAEANQVLSQPLTRDDIIGTWAGLRPLLQPPAAADAASARVSREHAVAWAAPGLVSIAGGKLTTYRVMAKDAVDFILEEGARVRPSRTAGIRLVGAHADPHDQARACAQTLARQSGAPAATAEHLLHRYGTDVARIAEICAETPQAACAIDGAPAYLRAEIIFAIRAEGALHLDDILDRRTRISYEYPEGGAAALDEIAEIAADELGWTATDLQRELASYRAAHRAYAHALLQPDDASAARALTHSIALRVPTAEAPPAVP